MWDIHGTGFLPFDPIEQLHPATPGGDVIEKAANLLPLFVANKSVRRDLVDALAYDNGLNYKGPKLTKQILNNFFNTCIDSPQQAERAMMLFSYFASSYIHAPGEATATVLPREIAVPLKKLSRIVNRPPILSYASYCLYNWRRLDPKKPIELGNVELLQNFTLSEGRRDENWFILVHVDIEAKAADAISSIDDLLNNPLGTMGWCPASMLSILLDDIDYSLDRMYKTLCRMPEECSTDVYYGQVRPYIFSYENVLYEPDPRGWESDGAENKPVTYRGETGAQSSCIPAIQLALGIKHKDSLLTQHLADMRNYMPPAHADWLRRLEQHGGIRGIAEIMGYEKEYNGCVEKLIEFRSKHLQYAIDYIQKKVSNPVGTGGTPYIKWLSQLVDETMEFKL